MAAHADAAGVVEEDHAEKRPGLNRRRQERSDDRVVTPRFANDGAPEMILVAREVLAALPHRLSLGHLPSVDDDTGRLPLGVGIDDGDRLRETGLAH